MRCDILFLLNNRVMFMQEKLTTKENALQAIKFVLFSASAGIIQAVSFTLLDLLFKNVETESEIMQQLFRSEYGVQYLVALILSVLWNFTFNRKFTFKSATNIPKAMLKVFGYYCVFTPLSTWLGSLATAHFNLGEGLGKYIVLAVTMITNMVTEFLFCRFVVYRDSINTAESAKK